MEVTRRTGDYALMGVGILISLDEDGRCEKARMVYLNAGDGPVEAKGASEVLNGKKYSETAVEMAAMQASQEEIDPFGSVHATVDYQRHLAYVLTKRALKQAFQRAQV